MFKPFWKPELSDGQVDDLIDAMSDEEFAKVQAAVDRQRRSEMELYVLLAAGVGMFALFIHGLFEFARRFEPYDAGVRLAGGALLVGIGRWVGIAMFRAVGEELRRRAIFREVRRRHRQRPR